MVETSPGMALLEILVLFVAVFGTTAAVWLYMWWKDRRLYGSPASRRI